MTSPYGRSNTPTFGRQSDFGISIDKSIEIPRKNTSRSTPFDDLARTTEKTSKISSLVENPTPPNNDSSLYCSPSSVKISHFSPTLEQESSVCLDYVSTGCSILDDSSLINSSEMFTGDRPAILPQFPIIPESNEWSINVTGPLVSIETLNWIGVCLDKGHYPYYDEKLLRDFECSSDLVFSHRGNFSSYREIFGSLGLTSLETRMSDELKRYLLSTYRSARLEDTMWIKNPFDEYPRYLIRVLQYNGFDIETSGAHIFRISEWLTTKGPISWSRTLMTNLLCTGSVYLNGYDQMFRPIMIINLAKFTNSLSPIERELILGYWFLFFRAHLAVNNKVEQMVILLDIMKIDSLSESHIAAMDAVKFMGQIFPDYIHKVFIYGKAKKTTVPNLVEGRPHIHGLAGINPDQLENIYGGTQSDLVNFSGLPRPILSRRYNLNILINIQFENFQRITVATENQNIENNLLVRLNPENFERCLIAENRDNSRAINRIQDQAVLEFSNAHTQRSLKFRSKFAKWKKTTDRNHRPVISITMRHAAGNPDQANYDIHVLAFLGLRFLTLEKLAPSWTVILNFEESSNTKLTLLASKILASSETLLRLFPERLHSINFTNQTGYLAKIAIKTALQFNLPSRTFAKIRS